jgi:hypothetical protein
MPAGPVRTPSGEVLASPTETVPSNPIADGMPGKGDPITGAFYSETGAGGWDEAGLWSLWRQSGGLVYSAV